jgi:hypothetical protein
MLDTPGYPDFVGAALGALNAVETAVIVVSAPNGLEVNTRRMFNEAGKRGLGRMLVINKMDAENIKFDVLVKTIQDTFGKGCVLFNAPVATGSGKELVGGSDGQWRFETPRGRLTVQAKDENPAWVPPDWHYVEQAHKKGLGIIHLDPGEAIPTGDGGVITTRNGEVVRRYGNGAPVSLGGGVEGKEIVVNGNIVVPPYGTTARRYMGVLGTRRLDLGDGYGIHGTDHPETIGQSVSHGCVRMRNEDVERLYPMVAIGTPVYIY